MQAGGAARVGEERRLAAERDPSGAEETRGVLERVGNYLGSWVGLSPVSEHEGALSMPQRSSLCTLEVCGVHKCYLANQLGTALDSELRVRKLPTGQLPGTAGCK